MPAQKPKKNAQPAPKGVKAAAPLKKTAPKPLSAKTAKKAMPVTSAKANANPATKVAAKAAPAKPATTATAKASAKFLRTLFNHLTAGFDCSLNMPQPS